MKKHIIMLTIIVLGITGYTETLQERLLKLSIVVPKDKLESIDFELEDMKGALTKLSSYRGKFVFLNFWATWCGPCRIEMPSMQRVYEELKGEGFVIVAVNLQEDRKLVKRFLDQYGLTFPVLLDKTGRVGATYGARSIPTTYLIDREGYIIGRAIGAREWDTPEIQSLFQEILEKGVAFNEPSLKEKDAVVLTGDIKEFTIETYNWGFNFSAPTIRIGDKVRIRMKGTQGTHGVAIPEFAASSGPVKKGEVEYFEFIASIAGKILIQCYIPCGRGHRGMKSILMIVE